MFICNTHSTHTHTQNSLTLPLLHIQFGFVAVLFMWQAPSYFMLLYIEHILMLHNMPAAGGSRGVGDWDGIPGIMINHARSPTRGCHKQKYLIEMRWGCYVSLPTRDPLCQLILPDVERRTAHLPHFPASFVCGRIKVFFLLFFFLPSVFPKFSRVFRLLPKVTRFTSSISEINFSTCFGLFFGFTQVKRTHQLIVLVFWQEKRFSKVFTLAISVSN